MSLSGCIYLKKLTRIESPLSLSLSLSRRISFPPFLFDIELVALIQSSSEENNDNSTTITTTSSYGGSDGIIVQLDGKLPDNKKMAHRQRFHSGLIRLHKVTAIIPKIAGLLSMLGSSYIIYSIVGTRRGRVHKFKSTFNRLLVALSVFDLISSFANFLSHWMFPVDEFPGIDPEWHDVTFPYASGNDTTCSMQVRKTRRIDLEYC